MASCHAEARSWGPAIAATLWLTLLKKNGETRLVDLSDEVVKNIHDLGVEALIAVGGDGTLKIARALQEKGVPMVGVPKTIDNDLRGTDVTFGYNTAVNIVTEALDRLHTYRRESPASHGG